MSKRTGINRTAQQQRQPGLQIVIVQSDGTKEVAYQHPAALIEATPGPDAVVDIPPDLE